MQEGGRAWLLVFGAWMCVLMEHGSLKAMAVMLFDIQEDFYTKTWIIGSITALMTGTGSLFGMLTDMICRHVHRRWIVVLCGCLTCIGYIISSQATLLELFAPVLIFCCGIGQEIAHLVTMGMLVEHFDDRYGLAISIVNSGTSLALLVVAPVTQYLKELFTWRGAMLIIGAASFHIVACGLLIPTRIRMMASTPAGPQPHQYDPIIDDITTARKRGRFWNAIRYITSITHVSMFRDVHFTAHIIAWFAANYSLVGWFIFLIPCAEQKGIAPNKAVVLSTFGGVSSIIFRFIAAFCVDRNILPVQVLQVCVFALSGSLLISHAFVDSFNGLAALTVAYGGVSGFTWLTLYYRIKQIVGIEKIIPGLAWSSLAGAISGSLVGIVSGRIDEVVGRLDAAFVVLGAPMLFAALCVGIAARCSSIPQGTFTGCCLKEN